MKIILVKTKRPNESKRKDTEERKGKKEIPRIIAGEVRKENTSQEQKRTEKLLDLVLQLKKLDITNVKKQTDSQ